MLCTGHVPWAVCWGGGGVERHTLFWENITFSYWLDDPRPFFQPKYRNDPPPFSKVYLRPCVPPSPLFLKILRDSQVPQLENLAAKSLCLCSQTCAYFHSCTSPFSHGFPFCIFTHIGIPPDDRKLTSLSIKFGEL